ncbi:MAG: PP2C family protein-serine/threonine phosphatase [Terracidiphilus sp.]
MSTGVPVWSRPAFDDSAWSSVDLTPAPDSSGGFMNTPGWIPGWTGRGYPNLTGFAWYRIRLNISNPAQNLWLKMPGSFEDAYEIYANGQLVGSFGDFTATELTTYFAQPAAFPLPQLPPDGQLELALRVHMSPATLIQMPGAGGLHGPPVIGVASTIQLLQASDRDTYVHAFFGAFLVALLTLVALWLALWALARSFHERVWLWLSLALAVQALACFIAITAGLTTVLSAASADLLCDAILAPAGLALWVLFWWSWFRLERTRWIAISAIAIAVAHFLLRFIAISPVLGFDLVDPSRLQFFNIAAVLAVTGQSALLIFILKDRFETRESEAISAALPVLMLILSGYTRYFSLWFSVPYVFRTFGVGFSLTDVAHIVMVAAVTTLVASRFLQSSIRKSMAHQILDQDLEQAHALQQRVLVPESLHSPHFFVEVEHSPAQEVGGDFFVTIVGPDASLCVVIGDVSGKGISAAMLVAVLVGAARTRASQDFDPITMLQTLDERLSGRSGGHLTTCLAAQIYPNGILRVANAGHMPPYLNGCELDLEGSVPLGIAGVCNPTKRQFQLRQGDVLTFLTDGVTEAKNAEGKLLGFEKTRILSQKSPAEILSEVQAYGQEDDITAIRVSFIRSESIGPAANMAARQHASV